MYGVEMTYRDFRSGEVRRVMLRQTYKTRVRAERAAQAVTYVCRPDGGTATVESIGLVLLVP